ncbi:unnamed protein product [Schistosoma mattheei]|uniref:Uncharacterized protein n=1 Tax=Schistosoma mattheei TaxID=31246 RepID=A0A3P8E0V0_9TREM|nr:unnamed protein product [Schistosoma mattheei]
MTFHRNVLSDGLSLYCFFSNSSIRSCFLLTFARSPIPRDSLSASRRSIASTCNRLRVSKSTGPPPPPRSE